jgi:molecular chaperone HtpG
VILHLREGEDEFLSGWKLKSIISKYSDHISLPILMRKETVGRGEEGPGRHRRVGDGQQGRGALDPQPRATSPTREYQDFYKQISYDSEAPLAYTHNRVEGRTEYTQLLYVPAKAPFDLWNRDKRGGVKLYVKRVFIMDDAEALMPVYLRFVKGVIDSADLPLNVSRELLQESRDVKAIREGCTKRVLSMLEDVAENQKEKYAAFWKEFGAVLKEGIGEDFANQERLAKLLRFASTHADEGVSLADYVSRMKEGQDAIYYVTADTLAAAQGQPAARDLPQEGHRGAAAGRPRRRVDALAPVRVRGQAADQRGQGRVDLGKLQDEDEKKAAEPAAEAFKPVLERLKTALKDRAKDVRVDHPAGGLAGLHRRRRGRHVLAPGAHAEAGRPEAPKSQAHPRGQPQHALVKRLESPTSASTTWRRSCSTRPAGRGRSAR